MTKIYKYLVPREYFGTVRTIIDSRVPPVMSETIRPPTPLAGEILQMVLTPVHLAAQSQVEGPTNWKEFSTYLSHLLQFET